MSRHAFFLAAAWALAFSSSSFAQSGTAPPLGNQAFVLEIREGHACNFDGKGPALTDVSYRGEKLCRVTSRSSFNGKTDSAVLFDIAAGPDVFAIMDHGYVVPHSVPSLYLLSGGLPVKSRRVAFCLVAHMPLKINFLVNVKALLVPSSGEPPRSPCAIDGYIQTPADDETSSPRWTNLVLGSQNAEGQPAAEPYLVQFRVVIPGVSR